MENIDLDKVQEDERKIEIEDLRREIEDIDDQVFKLLEKRLEASTKIGKLKAEDGKDVYDPKREEEVIKNVVEEDYNLPDEFVEELMRSILKNMRSISQNRNE